MNREADSHRWLVVVGALIIQVSLGAVYIWSVFQTPLMAAFPDWSETAVTLPAQLVLAFFALAVVLGGRLQDRFGPRRVALAGGALLGLGLVLSWFSQFFPSPAALVWLIGSFSLLGGFGIGMAYVCPIATCVKWFPDKRGVVTGLAVAGFGAGAFFFAPLARGLISGGAYQIFGVGLFPLPHLGLFGTFLALGGIFFCSTLTGAQFLRNPPPGFVPPGWAPGDIEQGETGTPDFSPSEMLRTPLFWLLWASYLVGCAAGLQVIMKVAPIWESFSMAGMASPIPEITFMGVSALGTTAVSVLAVFNSSGRILWGKVSDSIGRKNTLVAMFLLCGVVLLLLDGMRSYPLFLLGISLVGLCFGGYLAIYPAVTADLFGTRNIGANYGWMYSAYGVGGLAGPFLAARLMRVEAEAVYLARTSAGAVAEHAVLLGSYRPAFLVAGAGCLVAGAVLLCYLPRVPSASQPASQQASSGR
ncbi:MFS transporter, OFA family, oxalate/formate antiporter [Alkalispirochaeta americana]|uniref:MFS transporter, OFA family, oxalate/formate antiporter n=1 Tax=Alkalispirochaeta americana TaxID=159291 RepID=A0A1N6SW38_9SPIO|nr:OFA family MFS transporter [Alkalispirochaeta americana]SIQ45333.1 MFS transporter, OFA family, oxalate/formate antiporter [Alkalispirochaeta americana]